MNSKKNTSSAHPKQEKSIAGRYGSIDSKAMRHLVPPDAAIAKRSTAETFAVHIQRQTSRAFFDAVSVWGLDQSGAARLVGVEPATIAEWKAGTLPSDEEAVARMKMVALIRAALDIAFSPSLAAQWMTVPNSGYPYLGVSPVAYIGEHGWPGLFWVLHQTQARAVGN